MRIPFKKLFFFYFLAIFLLCRCFIFLQFGSFVFRIECLSVIELLVFFKIRNTKGENVNKAKRVETINILLKGLFQIINLNIPPYEQIKGSSQETVKSAPEIYASQTRFLLVWGSALILLNHYVGIIKSLNFPNIF